MPPLLSSVCSIIREATTSVVACEQVESEIVMAKTSQRASEMIEEPEDQVEVKKGRRPDFEIKVRQPPYRDKATGKIMRSDRFTVVGAAWQQVDKDGQVFYGCNLTVPNMVFADNSFILYPPYRRDED